MTASKKPKSRAEAELREFGLALPNVTEEFPWDHRALKVARKIFAILGTDMDEKGIFTLSCKLPASASMALMLPGVAPTGYGLGKSNWVSGKFPSSKVPVAMLKDWMRESYCAVAPKKLAARVDGASSEKTATKAKPAAKKAKPAAKKAKPAAKKNAAPKSGTKRKAALGRKPAPTKR